TEPSTTEPSTTEPSTTESSTTEPSTTEPSTTEPSTTELSTTESSGNKNVNSATNDRILPKTGEKKSFIFIALGAFLLMIGTFIFIKTKNK
ncbi:TPA: LPXTG cell wall anchor domain-containing protein, partial [Enterococcus faecalis]